MIQNIHPLLQAGLGGLLTWGLTALGAAAVFPFRSQNKKVLGECRVTSAHSQTDASLGFAAGIMTAASFWSLLAPGIERAQEQMNNSPWACLPIALGFACGAAFVWAADFVLPFLGFSSEDMVTAFITNQVQFIERKSHGI